MTQFVGVEREIAPVHNRRLGITGSQVRTLPLEPDDKPRLRGLSLLAGGEGDL